MDIHQKLSALKAVYDLYAEFTSSCQTACRPHCAVCCTNAVTLTTLEAYHLRRFIRPGVRRQLDRQLVRKTAEAPFRPAPTINDIARRCAAGETIPPEPDPHPGGQCPLLEADLCPIYDQRPFACRCMMSARRCDTRQYASMDPFILTVNHLFQQAIEHIDAGGCSGHLIDVWECLASGAGQESYRNQSLSCRSHRLVRNTPLTVLMIPPDHRQRIKPLWSALQSIRIPA